MNCGPCVFCIYGTSFVRKAKCQAFGRLVTYLRSFTAASAIIMICYVLFCRHALEDSLERAFVPGLAAVISFIDVRGNIRMIQAPGDLNNLWLRLFSECGKLGLKYSQLTAGQQGSVS